MLMGNNMKKYKCEVIKTYEYEIEINENVWTAENLKKWSQVFSDVDNLEELAGILAEYKTWHKNGEFIEGFGVPYINGSAPYVSNDDELSPDININIVNESDCDVDVCEI